MSDFELVQWLKLISRGWDVDFWIQRIGLAQKPPSVENVKGRAISPFSGLKVGNFFQGSGPKFLKKGKNFRFSGFYITLCFGPWGIDLAGLESWVRSATIRTCKIDPKIFEYRLWIQQFSTDWTENHTEYQGKNSASNDISFDQIRLHYSKREQLFEKLRFLKIALAPRGSLGSTSDHLHSTHRQKLGQQYFLPPPTRKISKCQKFSKVSKIFKIFKFSKILKNS